MVAPWKTIENYVPVSETVMEENGIVLNGHIGRTNEN